MSERLKGHFVGCPYHNDDYEACIQYSGQAPCDPPDGWRLVPLEPTEEMRRLFNERLEMRYHPNSPYRCQHTWEAMLQAAPSPGQEE